MQTLSPLHQQACVRGRLYFRFPTLLLALLCCCFLLPNAFAQRETGTISGTVQDQSHAVIPNANVTLTSTTTGDKRTTVSNGEGMFTFAAVPPGTYNLTITAAGFSDYNTTGIVMHAGEDHKLTDLAMAITGQATQVEVTAELGSEIPTDNGESSTTITQDLVDNLSIQGRNASELVKFMPGMGLNSGLNQSEFNSQTTATNSGPIGSFSANGTQPYGGMQMTLDGAGLIDIGNMGTQIANVNQDQTAEFTYLNAAFGADTARGPTIMQITSKAGGQKYHGDVYIYGRDWQANANDAYYKAANPGATRPMDHQWYPGATLGGPVRIPGIGFNKNRDKLFFFAGFEKMFQTPFPTLHYLVTPTEAMLNGDFSTATLPGAQSPSSLSWSTSKAPCSAAPTFTQYCGAAGQPGFADWSNGILVNKAAIDPNGLALMSYFNRLHPPNVDPATHNGYNYQFLDQTPVNRWELRLRGDFDPTQNDKFSVVYTQQNEADINNFGIWWAPGDAAPVPSSLHATTLANLWTVNYTRILNPTTTNEASFSYSYFTFPPAFVNPAAMSMSAIGMQNVNPFGTPADLSLDQIPNIISWANVTGNNTGSFSSLYAPPMIKGFNNAYGNVKKIYGIQDNFTKVMGRHSVKAGVFWDDNNQLQTTGYGNWPQGMMEFDNWGNTTTGNEFADELLGHVQSESQTAAAPPHDMTFNEWAIYGQDAWHVTQKLTLNYGVRFEHEGQWYPNSGPGLAVFDPAAYDIDSNHNSGIPSVPWPGMRWHQNDRRVPISGFPSRFLSPDPRVGAAYDIHGNGKTVIRGGWGLYRFQFSEGAVDPALNPSWNVASVTTGSTMSMAELASFKPSSSSWCALPTGATSGGLGAYGGNNCPTGVQAIRRGEDRNPYTMNWVAMVDQELPARMVFELQYIGNATRDVLLTGQGSTENFYSNINKIPVGGLYGAYSLPGSPNDGQNLWEMACASGTCGPPNANYYSGYRPIKDYGVLDLIEHGSYSNYHGMVAALQKQTGHYTFLINYTWSKVLGIRDGQTINGAGDGAMVDPFNLRANYGPLAYDHTHIFNAAYVFHLPGAPLKNGFLQRFTSGWDLSGATQLQSGAPIQPNTGGNLNAQYQPSDAGATGSTFTPGNTYMLGTNAVILMPYLSCDPRNTSNNANFNVSCFNTPTTLGVNGPTVWPYIHGPKYLESDLAVFKSFNITEAQNIQFRASAFNFLNHALPQFGLGSDINLHLGCASTTTGSLTPTCDQGGTNINPQTTGRPYYETGRRVIEVALKYNF